MLSAKLPSCCRATRGARDSLAVALSVLVLLGCLSCQVEANGENGVYFIYPDGIDNVFHRGDTVLVTYTTPFPSPILFTFCSPGYQQPIKQVSVKPIEPYSASVPILLDFTAPEDCWFNIKPNDTGKGANSYHWTFKQDRRPQATTIGLQYATATIKPPNMQPSPTGQPSVATHSSNSGNGLNTGSIVGICVGVSGLAVVLGALGVACFLRRRRQRTSHGGVVSYSQAPGSDSREKPSTNSYSNLHSASSYQALTGADGYMPRSGNITPPSRSAQVSPSKAAINMDSLSEGFFRHKTGAAELRSGGFGLDGSALDASPSFHEAHPTVELPQLYEADGHDSGSLQSTPIAYRPAVENDYNTSSHQVASLASIHEPAELPSREGHRGFGQDFEMPILQRPTPFPHPPYRKSVAEQKVLLQDTRAWQIQGMAPPAYHSPIG